MEESTGKILRVTISMSRECPSLEPVTEPFQYQGETFSVTQLEIVGEAIDEGVFYMDPFKDFCRAKWEQAHPSIDLCLTSEHLDGIMQLPEEYSEGRTIVGTYKERLTALPRGAWAMFERRWDNGENSGTTYTLVISKGDGTCYVPQFGSIEGKPTYAMAMARMVGYEIYCARRAEETRRERVRSRAVTRGHGWTVGSKLKNIRISATRYSSAVIVKVLESGHLVLQLTKRGSRNRWECTVLAQAIQLEEDQTHSPAYGQWVDTWGEASA